MTDVPRLVAADGPYFLKKTPQQERALTTVESIIDAAAQILIAEGYAKASTNRIAERAGVSIGSVYEYFPGKAAIFAELGRRESIKWYTTLVSEPRPESPKEVIRHLIEGRVAFVRDNLEIYVALETEVPRSAMADLDAAVFNDFKALSVEFFATRHEDLRAFTDLEFLAELLMRTVSATIHDYAIHAPQHLYGTQLSESLIEMLEQYLLLPNTCAG